ncbi:hypothetical protein [Desulforhopalus sp. 52FAK]
MVSSISNSMNSATMMSNSSMSRPPEGKNAFTVSDTNGDGVVSGTELDALAAGLSDATGTTVTTESFSSFDSDSNGLSGQEMFDMLSSIGFSPAEAEGDKQGNRPPPPPPPDSSEVISAYSQNSGERSDLMTTLLDAIGSSSDDEGSSTSIRSYS